MARDDDSSIEIGQTPLRRPEHEAYAVNRAAGMSPAEAYADVYGGKRHANSAWRLDNRPEVRRRIGVLRRALEIPRAIPPSRRRASDTTGVESINSDKESFISDDANVQSMLAVRAGSGAAGIAAWVGQLADVRAARAVAAERALAISQAQPEQITASAQIQALRLLLEIAESERDAAREAAGDRDEAAERYGRWVSTRTALDRLRDVERWLQDAQHRGIETVEQAVTAVGARIRQAAEEVAGLDVDVDDIVTAEDTDAEVEQ